MGGETRRTSISLPKELLEKGQKIARMRRRNFSNYIADLIASDIPSGERGGPKPTSEAGREPSGKKG